MKKPAPKFPSSPQDPPSGPVKPEGQTTPPASERTLDDILKDIGGAPTPPPPPNDDSYVKIPDDPLLAAASQVQITETPLTPESFTERASRLAAEGKSYIEHVNEQAGKSITEARAPAQSLAAFAHAEIPQRVVAEGVTQPSNKLPEPEPGEVYAQRISVITAYKFVGQVAKAPAWVDRNWVSWQEKNEAYDAGPALAVTDPEGREVGRARVGDYVCVQEITTPEGKTLRKMAVMSGPEFERLYRREGA